MGTLLTMATAWVIAEAPAGYTAMLQYARRWPDRVWAIEGCQGIGRHIAGRPPIASTLGHVPGRETRANHDEDAS